MFEGSDEISMDAKGRIAIPTRVRELLAGVCHGKIVVTASMQDRCLTIYPFDVWTESVVPQIQDLPVSRAAARAKRLVIGYAKTFTLEENGRVQLPPELRKYGQFEKKLMLAGLGNKFELWDSDAWFEANLEEFDEGDMPDAMKGLKI